MSEEFAKLFERAAELVDSGMDNTCCGALWGLAHHYSHKEPHVKFLNAVLKPKNKTLNDYWYGDSTPNNRAARVMGLLLCARLVREGFTAKDFAHQ